MFDRLVKYWVYGTLPAGFALLALTPLVCWYWPPLLVATFLVLPVYMLHQYEEHENDRFLRFLAAKVGKGWAVLTQLDSFLINVPVVWGLALGALYLAVRVDFGYGLMVFYLLLVNAFVHCVSAVVFRGYNPGLGTALVLFIPLGFYGVCAVNATGSGSVHFHLLGAGVAVGLHILLLLYAKLFKLKTT
jgi:hypothetical protein